ncbi:MAG: TOPRIM nucleotidyl transferase/hydrolase domain-containing protein [Candidatus Acidiferrales bacterium]
MRKKVDLAVGLKPFAIASHVDLSKTNERDQFQIVCYENNNIAFFSESVVLVEGDSDYIALAHLARVINPARDCRQVPVAFARISGKGCIRRYCEFFRRFQMRVSLITDLDFLLGAEFFQIDPAPELRDQREQFIRAVDAVLETERREGAPAVERAARAEQKPRIREAYRRAGQLEALRRVGQATSEQVDAAFREAEDAEREWARTDVLKKHQDAGFLEQKRALLEALRNCDVYVWEKGAIDDYDPAGITGNGKPARAQSFCGAVGTREQAIALCAGGHRKRTGEPASEFEAVFDGIFRA